MRQFSKTRYDRRGPVMLDGKIGGFVTFQDSVYIPCASIWQFGSCPVRLRCHSMLALYHLFSGTPPGELVGVDAVMADAGTTKLPKVNRVVLVGNKISPGNPRSLQSIAKI
jgi:hypothetical protein